MTSSKGSSQPRDQILVSHIADRIFTTCTTREAHILFYIILYTVQSCLTFWNPMDCSTPGFPIHHQLPEFTQIHVHFIGDAIQPSHPLSSPSPPAFPSIRVFSNESVLWIRWQKYWSFSFSICPCNKYSGLISFRMDWLDLHYVILYKICNRVLFSHKKIKSYHLWHHG